MAACPFFDRCYDLKRTGVRVMTDWKKDLDSLVEQTLAFVQRVKKEQPVVVARPIESSATVVEPALHEPPLTRNLRPNNWVSERDEIAKRVPSFRAPQQQFQQERAACYQQVLAKARASIQPLDN